MKLEFAKSLFMARLSFGWSGGICISVLNVFFRFCFGWVGHQAFLFELSIGHFMGYIDEYYKQRNFCPSNIHIKTFCQ